MSIHEIRVKPSGQDPEGQEVSVEIERTMGIVVDVGTENVYRFEGISEAEAAHIAEALTNPLTQVSVFDDDIELGLSAEVSYKSGVMNPEAASLLKLAGDAGVEPSAAHSSITYSFSGDITPTLMVAVVDRLLVNKAVQEVEYTIPETLKFDGEAGLVKTVPVRVATTEELRELSKDKLFLNDEEMVVVQEHFSVKDRDPTDGELETIAAYWSEHCGHKTFSAVVMARQEDGTIVEKEPLMARIKKGAEAQPSYEDLVVSAFGDNSGVMSFYDGMAICGKVETHNSPSAIEPYGGAMTGSGGVFRDIMGTGKGAKTIISTDMFCFASSDLAHSELPPGTLHPDYMQRRVVQGVRDYGNRMGIPTANGSVHYHEDFRAKPTIIVGAYGIMPEIYAHKGQPEVGDLVVVLGGRTGRDGIHGATFSSGEMTSDTINKNSSAVQIGNAIEQKRMFDALIEARDLGYIKAMTDCGAAGFCSAIGEMGEEIGVTVDISKAPLKNSGLDPWEIWMSESQERMVTAIEPINLEGFLEVCKKYNVEATMLGEFDGSHTLTVNYGDTNVVELEYEFLKNGLPQRVMNAYWDRPEIPLVKPTKPSTKEQWLDVIKKVMAHGNVHSKEQIVCQYDHGVQGGNIVPPYGGINQEGPNDALVIRPMLDKPYGVVQSHGMNPILIRLDPSAGTIWAVTEAAANYVAVGGKIEEAVAVGNYIWPFPDEEAMGSLDKSVDAAVEMMGVLDLPVISGKDSLSSTYRSDDGQVVIKIPPVYAMSIFGRIPDVEKTMTSEFKKPGTTEIFLVGAKSKNMGGSTYYDVAGGQSGDVPHVDLEQLPEVLKRVQSAIHEGSILACHDVSEGGVVAAVAEMCFGSDSGASLVVPEYEDPETYLFNETAGCFVVEVENTVLAARAFQGVPYQHLGSTNKDAKFEIRNGWRDTICNTDISELKAAWQAPMKELFH